MTAVLLATPDLQIEPLLVRAAPIAGLRVVRRCVDAAELLATAAGDLDALIVLSVGLPRLSAAIVGQVARGRVVIGLAASDAEHSRLRALGVASIVAVREDPERTARELARVAAEGRAGGHAQGPAAGHEAEVALELGECGLVVVVWGPQGAPGRTTVALGIADALARRGSRVCLVDADTFAPSIALALGMVEDASGLVAACRLADMGTLRSDSLGAVMTEVRPGLLLLSGVSAPDRGSDVRPAALEQVIEVLRTCVDVVVVDAGFCLDAVEDTVWSRPRNAVERAVVPLADHLLAVADSSAFGAARLALAWPDLQALATGPVEVVRNRVPTRGRRAGVPSRGSWLQAVHAAGIEANLHELPADRTAARAWSHGLTVGEMAPRSRLHHALTSLAAHVAPG